MTTRATPYVLCTHEKGRDRAILGFRIPYLPDFLASPHRVGATDRERLQEVLEHQARLVANLWKWQSGAFALRYLYEGAGEVKVAFVARAFAPPEQGQAFGEAMASDLVGLLASFGYPIEPMGEEELTGFIDPFSSPGVVEIRQQEDIIPLLFLGPAYVVYPFQPPTTTWIPIFEALLRQQLPCLISLHLEPTSLTEAERNALAEAAKLAETGKEQELRGPMGTMHVTARDPHALVVSHLYADLLVSLSRPFHVIVQIATKVQELQTAWALAQVVGSEITVTADLAEAAQGDTRLPAGCDVCIPDNAAELEKARRTLVELELRHWGQSRATEGKERLRYLADARRASAAFRFPIAMRGGIPGIRVKQPLPVFEVVTQENPQESIALGIFAGRGIQVHLPLRAINRHVLVAGTTGSGKTTTCVRLLVELWRRGIPTLVIEPAKTEYRALLESEIGSDIQVFTLGDEVVSPFRLNPLEILPGVRVERHISYLKAAFAAALPTFPILPSLIEESLYRIYSRKGWRFTDEGISEDVRPMPTLDELYREILRVAEERGYQRETMQDVRAAASGRIKPFLLGSKGQMFNVPRSISMDVLMTRPTILELESLNDEEKALVILFLLTMLHEYVRTTRRERGLQHVTIIEEAHRVMARATRPADPEAAPATAAAAVSMFAAMLSEIRAYGEGIVIAEQIPQHLADDAVKNTNVKIVHQLPGEDDRRVIGAAMSLGEEQEPYIAKLEPGWAAFFTEGYEKPTFIHVNKYPDEGELPDRVEDERVQARMGHFRQEHAALFLPFPGCAFCEVRCAYRDRVALMAYEQENRDAFRSALFRFEGHLREGKEAEGWQCLAKTCSNALRPLGLGQDIHAGYCYFVHLSERPVSRGKAVHFKRTYQAEATEG